MFDSELLVELDVEQTASAMAACHRRIVEQSDELLRLAAHWADLHPAEALREETGRGHERPWQVGGVGTPLVSDFSPTEIGALLETSTTGAMTLVGDALDLRHRLPGLWTRVCAGQVPAWKARKVAKATRHLDPAGAAAVDAAVRDCITSLPWSRFEDVLAGKIVEADPEQAEARERLAAAERFVRAGRSNEHGLKLLVARARAGEVIWFVAMVNRIADILRDGGDGDPIDVRRSKAIGILAQPALALQMLYDHRDDPDRLVDRDDRVMDTPPTSTPDDPHASVVLRPAGFDPARARPPVTLYLHLSEEALTAGRGVARLEGVGPVTLAQVRQFLGGCQVNLKPVIDLPAGLSAVDGYEAPAWMREYLHLAQPADAFPYGVHTGAGQDLDHAVPYLAPARGGPPGQTGPDRVAWLSRYHHRVATHGRWRRRQPEAGVRVWRSPLGWHYLVNASGTHPLGRGRFAEAVWRAADAGPPQGRSEIENLVTARMATIPKIVLEFSLPTVRHHMRSGRPREPG